jgi:hypothetical protein
MSVNQLIGICDLEGLRKIDISYERIALWALVFTNTFFITFFFAKLFNLI